MGSSIISSLLEEISYKGPILPENSPSKDHITERERRRHFVDHYSWAVPSLPILEEISTFLEKTDKVLEVYAGTGLWALLIKNLGFNVIATDKAPYSPVQFTEVLNINSEEAVEQFKECNVLLMCWPPYNCNSANNCFKKFRGNKIIYIGEKAHGCTATPNFYTDLYNNFDVKITPMKRWFGIYDYLFLCERKI